MIRNRHGRIWITGLLLGLLAIIVACGGDSATEAPAATTEPAAAPAATTAPAMTAAPAATTAPAAGTTAAPAATTAAAPAATEPPAATAAPGTPAEPTATPVPTPIPTATTAPPEFLAKVGGQLIHVPASDISFLDPSPSGILPDFYHGMLAFDHLFGMDANGVPQPQMVDDWSVSADGRSWTFTLRDNLMFHDGSPVTTDEVICSLERNLRGRSVLGKLLAVDLDRMEKVDDKTFNIELTADFGLVLDTLAENAVGSAIIYTMDDCVVDPLEAADVKIGNGPMRFVEWNPGLGRLVCSQRCLRAPLGACKRLRGRQDHQYRRAEVSDHP